MCLHKIALFTLLVLPACAASAQTNAPAKSAKTKPVAAKSSAIVVEPGSEKWGDVPAAALVGTPSVEMGGTLRLAVLQGNPTKAGGTYTVRLSCTDGLKIAPHWHPTAENVTVVKGSVAIGMGSKWDDAALKEIGTGGFASAPAQMRHFAQCKGDTILQVHGIGPFLVNFVSTDDSAAPQKSN